MVSPLILLLRRTTLALEYSMIQQSSYIPPLKSIPMCLSSHFTLIFSCIVFLSDMPDPIAWIYIVSSHLSLRTVYFHSRLYAFLTCLVCFPFWCSLETAVTNIFKRPFLFNLDLLQMWDTNYFIPFWNSLLLWYHSLLSFASLISQVPSF